MVPNLAKAGKYCLNNFFIAASFFALLFTEGCKEVNEPVNEQESYRGVSCLEKNTNAVPFVFEAYYTAYDAKSLSDSPHRTFLYRPVIALPPDLSWNAQRLKQLDFMLKFCRRFPKALPRINILDLDIHSVNEVNAARKSVDSILATLKNASNITTGILYSPPIPVCVDSLVPILRKTKEHLLYLDIGYE